MTSSGSDITALLVRTRGSGEEAFDALFPLVYDELRTIARQRLRRHRPGETLNTTALVHEAYLKLVDQSAVEWSDRAHFFALASRAMRFIIIDYARARTAEKRGGGNEVLSLNDVDVASEERAVDLLRLHRALDQLTEIDERLGHIVEYRFFGGMTYEEIAEVTQLSVPTLKRDWRRARTWLYRVMQEPDM